jgi:hypothetical protein
MLFVAPLFEKVHRLPGKDEVIRQRPVFRLRPPGLRRIELGKPLNEALETSGDEDVPLVDAGEKT